MNKRLLCLAAVMTCAGILPLLAADATKNSATVSVRNETGYYLLEIYRAVEGDSDWGEDILGEEVTIAPYESQELRIPAGYAWVRALFDVEGTEVEIVEEADFESGGEYVWTITEEMIWENYESGDDTYGYYDDTYGYYDWTYGYYDDTYGYYEDTYGYWGD